MAEFFERTGQASGAFVYDGNLKRVKQTVNGRTIYSVYGLGGRLLYRDDATGNETTDYIAAGGVPVGRWVNGVPQYVHHDHLGSPVAATDGIGAVLWREEYLPFGAQRQNPAGNEDDIGYTGHVQDAATGLTYMQARYYDPVIGRFLSQDPVGFSTARPEMFNRYAYVANDPINHVDPDGQFLGAASKLVKLVIKGGDIGATFAGAAADTKTLFSGEASLGERALAAISLASEIGSPVSLRDAKAGVNAIQAAKTCCFVAGTLIETEEGLRPIEEIEVGDKVWARDVETGETALKRVTDLIRRHERVIWEVVLAGPGDEVARCETTDDHPWWTAGQGWRTTEELAAGIAMVTRDGRRIVAAAVSQTSRTDATYNLTVSDFETYFVGEQRVLVHNCNPRSAAEGVKLQKQLASESQVSQLSEGGGTVISQPAKQADRIAGQTGANPSNVQKVSSDAFTAKDGQQIQTHSFRDATTNELIEPKTIIEH